MSDGDRLRDIAVTAAAYLNDEIAADLRRIADRIEALERERDQANATASDAKFQNDRLVVRVRALEDEAVAGK